jgi:hypothetical protein
MTAVPPRSTDFLRDAEADPTGTTGDDDLFPLRTKENLLGLPPLKQRRRASWTAVFR